MSRYTISIVFGAWLVEDKTMYVLECLFNWPLRVFSQIKDGKIVILSAETQKALGISYQFVLLLYNLNKLFIYIYIWWNCYFKYWNVNNFLPPWCTIFLTIFSCKSAIYFWSHLERKIFSLNEFDSILY